MKQAFTKNNFLKFTVASKKLKIIVVSLSWAKVNMFAYKTSVRKTLSKNSPNKIQIKFRSQKNVQKRDAKKHRRM